MGEVGRNSARCRSIAPQTSCGVRSGGGDDRAAVGERVKQRVDAADVVHLQKGEGPVRRPRRPELVEQCGEIVDSRLVHTRRARGEQDETRLVLLAQAREQVRLAGRHAGACHAIPSADVVRGLRSARETRRDGPRRHATAARRCCGCRPARAAARSSRGRSRRRTSPPPPARFGASRCDHSRLRLTMSANDQLAVRSEQGRRVAACRHAVQQPVDHQLMPPR